MSEQEQFLEVTDRDTATAVFRAAIRLQPLGVERVPVLDALGRVLAAPVLARVDVPAFDRANVDGYAVQFCDTHGAHELTPVLLNLRSEGLDAGVVPRFELAAGECVAIATGGMLPRGADAIVMVEHADQIERRIAVRRAVPPGSGIAFAGTDIALGETVLRAGTLLSSRETAVLAAVGEEFVLVWRKPRVAIISTGNELIAPGQPPREAAVYDSNSQALADAVRELGGTPVRLGIVGDDREQLRSAIEFAMRDADMVLLSGGTSKGQGDLCYRVVSEITDPGILVHGVALKPGKPLCLAASAGKAVVILPGFPTSAIFTFHEFVAPVIRELAGTTADVQPRTIARLTVKLNSEIGRTEYVLVGLGQTNSGLAAFPLGKGSGSVTSFARADGFLTIPRQTELLEVDQKVEVQLLSRELQLADLIVIGSHCCILESLLAELQRRGITSKWLSVGSSAGLRAAQQSLCDIAGIHLLDAQTGTYNRGFVTQDLILVDGYGRSQGLVFRQDDDRFCGKSWEEIISGSLSQPSMVMVNRNQGSGTRALIDRLLRGKQPRGYEIQPSTHSAVVAAILQQRADWGVAIRATVPEDRLTFLPIQDEQFDFVIPRSRFDRPAVQAFLSLLREANFSR